MTMYSINFIQCTLRSALRKEMEMLEHRLKAVQHTQGTDTGREQNQQGREERGEHGGAGSRNAGLEVGISYNTWSDT